MVACVRQRRSKKIPQEVLPKRGMHYCWACYSQRKRSHLVIGERMSGIKCAGCGAHITVRGLSKCPICKGPLAPIADSRLGHDPSGKTSKSKAGTLAPSATKLPISQWIGLICICGIVASIAVIIWSIANPSAESLRKRALADALVKCQYAIKSTASHGGAELPPYAKNYGTLADEFYFAWPRGSFEFQNGFGGKAQMSASCTGVLSTGKITKLTVNGKDIL